MARKTTLLDMLGHPQTQNVMQQLAQGVDPRLVAAKFAGDMLTKQMADGLGVRLPKPESIRRPSSSDEKSAKAEPRVTVLDPDEVIDAEYTVINVSPGVKRRAKKG